MTDEVVKGAEGESPGENDDRLLSEGLKNEPERKYAGKYATVEELEEAYKSSAAIFEENKTLKKKLEAPGEYEVPSELTLPAEELQAIKAIAKNANLTQEQFLKTAQDMQTRIHTRQKSYEDQRAAVGEENLNVLTEYVKKNYPASLHDTILSSAIRNNKTREELMSDRGQRLNSQIPGGGNAGIGGGGDKKENDTRNHLIKLREAHMEDPRDPKKKEAYIQGCREVGHSKKSA